MKLTAVTQFIPIGNVMLLTREMMMDQAGLQETFFVIISTVVYALGAFLLAAHVFQNESIILSQETGMPLTLDRSAYEPNDTPTAGFALGIFATVMVVVMYLGSLAQTYNQHWGLAATEYLFILGPVLGLLWYARIRWRSALNIRAAAWPYWIGTTLLAFGWIALDLQIGLMNSRVLPPPPELEESMLRILAIGETIPGMIILLLLIGVTPAICEEALFRGVLLSGLRGRLPAWAVIAIIGTLFGLFHLSVFRFLPTAATGFVLTYVALRGHSILLSALFHALFNSTLLLLQMGYLPERLTQLAMEAEEQGTGVPPSVLLISAGLCAAGIVLMEVTSRRRLLRRD